MTSFETYRQNAEHSRRSRGCPRCGDKAKPVGQVALVMRELGSTGQVSGGKQLASKARSFCESCTVEVYETLVPILIMEES